MEEKNVHQEELALLRRESEITQEYLPEVEVNRRLASVLGLPADAPVTLIREKFNLAILDELLYEFFGITERKKATMNQLGECMKQMKEFNRFILEESKK